MARKQDFCIRMQYISIVRRTESIILQRQNEKHTQTLFFLLTVMSTFSKLLLTVAVTLSASLASAKVLNPDQMWVEHQLGYCDEQIQSTLLQLPDYASLPRSICHGEKAWGTTDYSDWTSGFWPGILWYRYEYTHQKSDRRLALRYTRALDSLVVPDHVVDHDIGFQMICSYGNAYRLTGNKRYIAPMQKGAAKLAALFNPRVGTILSWPHMVKKEHWPHNTIMDNMMNLELLFFCAKHGGPREYYDMAVSHARTTMQNHFRPDYTCYHVALYDSISGAFIRGRTNQGYSDDSFWARGQAWAIYGYTMVYRETQDKTFLRFVEHVADVYLRRLPADLVPYWDFDDPKIPDAPRDASAAAIVASALIELSQLEDNRLLAAEYLSKATVMLRSLSSDAYLSQDRNPAFLMHSTGNLPGKYEIDASINYADYYYIEALTRLKNTINNN